MAKRRPRSRKRSRSRLRFWIGAPIALLAAVTLWIALLPGVGDLDEEHPKTTAVIEQRKKEAEAKGKKLEAYRSIVPLDRISPYVVEGAVLAEDARFYQHDGFDWREIKESVEENVEERRFVRGGSTISQQLAKNLFLGTKKSLWRKLKEAILTVKLERGLSKKRILSLYLNAVELGQGVFGVEAGARTHFGKSAADLSPHEAALLVGLLPAPRKASPKAPSKGLLVRAKRVLRLLREAGQIDQATYDREKAAIEARGS
jgi:monofunctional glycosyltransferase